jgi:hypothetical protein
MIQVDQRVKQIQEKQAQDQEKQVQYVCFFKLPIEYIENKVKIQQHIKTDLELEENTQTNTKSLYEYVFNPSNIFTKQTIPLWKNYYTSDKKFIKDSQKLLKKDIKYLLTNSQVEDVSKVMDDIEKETGFIEKYYYIDWPMFEKFNNHSEFLQWLSIYNMTSPVLSLFLPVFFLILPLFILKLQGIPISVTVYINILKQLFQRHSIGQLFNVGSASWDKLIYIIISIGFYILQIYQNIISCIKFYKNMKKIHTQLFIVRDYIDTTLIEMDHFSTTYKSLKTYKPFITDMNERIVILKSMQSELSQIEPNKVSIKKFKQIGHVMKCFYQLYKNEKYYKTLKYSFEFNGYLGNLYGLKENINNKYLSHCKIIKSGKNNGKQPDKFIDAYFPTLVNSNPVKNTYTLENHILITGPNAAGKTTMLKTTIFNIILSQQIGYGFYKSACLNPYDIIHCYINIPDTSGRDSLFQAEARRCKEILTQLEISSNTSRHFCVFDELYSGTNPYEAIGSAHSFLTYLNKYKNIRFMLTTHYLDLCKRLDNDKNIQNVHMDIEISNINNDIINQNFKYTYKMLPGISTIKGGIKVLIDLNYPTEIIDNTHNIIKGLQM